ncbi:MAG: hypothetical protein U9O94_08485 [Nanoarchaeota archaeon]|nr:hypothetical protein [Nanoarchaeota archaeon]
MSLKKIHIIFISLVTVLLLSIILVSALNLKQFDETIKDDADYKIIKKTLKDLDTNETLEVSFEYIMKNQTEISASDLILNHVRSMESEDPTSKKKEKKFKLKK